MVFDLKVTFTGMILYVPNLRRLHALMPRTPDALPEGGGTGCDCMEPHAPRLLFDSAYGRLGAQQLDDALTHVSLRRRRLDFPEAGSAYVRGVPDAIAHLPSPVRQEVLDAVANDELGARVTMNSGQATGAQPGDCWEWLNQLRRMSHLLEWTITGIEADHLDLPLLDLTSQPTGESVPRLYPIGGRLELQVWHVPPYELPPDPLSVEPPVDGTPNHHFTHLGVLLEGGVFPAPLYRPGQCAESPGAGTRGSTSLSCTGGQGNGGGAGAAP